MLVMISILVVGGMAVAYFGSRDNSIAISTNVSSASKARIAAESGLDLAIAILETDADWRMNHIDGVLLKDYPLADSFITVTVIDAVTNQPPNEATLEVEIMVESSVDGRSQLTQATAIIIPDDDEFDVDYSEYAVFVQDEISIRSVSTVQNWNASPAFTQEPVRLGTLATNPMAVQIDTFGYSSNIELHSLENASSMLTTTALDRIDFQDDLPFYDPPSAPIDGKPFNTEAVTNKYTASAWSNSFVSSFLNHSFTDEPNATTVASGTYTVDELTLFNTNNIVIQGDVVVNVEGDCDLTLATIVLEDDATLTLHIGGDLHVVSSYIGNSNRSTQSWMDPSRIQLYGHGSNEWSVTGNSTLKAEMYAPMCEIEFSGISTLCGRVAAESMSLRGASTLLYDQTLDHGGFADADGVLYDEQGVLRDELRQFSQLDPATLQSIESALYEASGIHPDATTENSFANHGYFSDWQNEPTERPHEVVYEILVHGTDARRWEQIARAARNADEYSTHGVLDDYSNYQELNVFDWEEIGNWSWQGSSHDEDFTWVDDR